MMEQALDEARNARIEQNPWTGVFTWDDDSRSGSTGATQIAAVAHQLRISEQNEEERLSQPLLDTTVDVSPSESTVEDAEFAEFLQAVMKTSESWEYDEPLGRTELRDDAESFEDNTVFGDATAPCDEPTEVEPAVDSAPLAWARPGSQNVAEAHANLGFQSYTGHAVNPAEGSFEQRSQGSFDHRAGEFLSQIVQGPFEQPGFGLFNNAIAGPMGTQFSGGSMSLGPGYNGVSASSYAVPFYQFSDHIGVESGVHPSFYGRVASAPPNEPVPPAMMFPGNFQPVAPFPRDRNLPGSSDFQAFHPSVHPSENPALYMPQANPVFFPSASQPFTVPTHRQELSLQMQNPRNPWHANAGNQADHRLRAEADAAMAQVLAARRTEHTTLEGYRRETANSQQRDHSVMERVNSVSRRGPFPGFGSTDDSPGTSSDPLKHVADLGLQRIQYARWASGFKEAEINELRRERAAIPEGQPPEEFGTNNVQSPSSSPMPQAQAQDAVAQRSARRMDSMGSVEQPNDSGAFGNTTQSDPQNGLYNAHGRMRLSIPGVIKRQKLTGRTPRDVYIPNQTPLFPATSSGAGWAQPVAQRPAPDISDYEPCLDSYEPHIFRPKRMRIL